MNSPLRICSSSEMRKLDSIAETEYGVDATLLMENAGRASAQVLIEKFQKAGKNSEILVFAGKGNNAGDAFVIARRLMCLERKVRIFHLVEGNEYKGAAKKNFDILQKMKAKLVHLDSGIELEGFFANSNGQYLAIDGIIGTGLKTKLEGIYYDVVEVLNRNVREIVALDIPTGVHGDTGAVLGTAIQASLTISYGFPKLGHFLPPGASKRGRLVNVDISLPPKFRKEGDKFLLMRNQIATWLEERDRYGHKNSFGHTLLIGGSPGRIGAISMAARATHKMGTGLVTVATWEDALPILMAKIPDETMAFPLKLTGPEFENYKERLHSYTSIVVGPGLGLRPEGKQLMEQLLRHYQGPLVIDADGLNLIADHHLHEYLMQRKAPTVLTPHPGEMARLLHISKEQVVEDPLAVVKQAIEKTHAVVLLKGAATVVGSVHEKFYLNHYPNDGMATAGSGDVLSGMIGGLLGQKMDSFQATLLGIYLHSLSGDFAAKQMGHRSMTAPDIIENIGNAFKDLKCTKEPAFPEEGRAWLL